MKKIITLSLKVVCIILLMTNMAYAMDISLAWDTNPEPDIAGYKLYYQADTATLPLAGFEAIEGNSPIDVGNQTNLTLTGLPDGHVFYIAVSAYNSAGVESAFSNIIASTWIPELIAPMNAALDESTAERFIWGAAPLGYDVTYTLYYGTDPELMALTTPTKFNWPKINFHPSSLVAILILLSLLYMLSKGSKKTFATGAMTLVIGLSLAGCGGGGGSQDGTALLSTPSDPALASPMTIVLDVGKSDYHEAYDLEPATTYYWKVVAQAVSNPNLRYESLINTFITAAN